MLRSCIYQTHSFISDIYRRIYISVVMGSTLRTIPLSYRKIFRFNILVTTNRTGLAACKKSIHSHKPFPLFLQFVFQKCCEDVYKRQATRCALPDVITQKKRIPFYSKCNVGASKTANQAFSTQRYLYSCYRKELDVYKRQVIMFPSHFLLFINVFYTNIY